MRLLPSKRKRKSRTGGTTILPAGNGPRCRCCDKPIKGAAFCRTCYDRANYQPDAGEINATLLEACRELLLFAEGGPQDATWQAWAIQNKWGMIDRAKLAIAQATEHTPAPS